MISNSSALNIKKVVCGKVVYDYLIDRGFPLLSKRDNEFIFSYTDDLKKSLDNMPMTVSILRMLKGEEVYKIET